MLRNFLNIKLRQIMYGVVDCNNFFVSCERVFNPGLEGKPVVVLSNNDGCVISRSQEAKNLGVKMGQPIYQIALPQLIKYSSNYALYSDMSRRVMSILATLVADMNVYSVDEAFIDFTGFSPEQIDAKAAEIVRKIKKDTGIPVCVGIAPTMTLAKVANKFAKKYKGYHGYCIIDSEEKRIKALKLTNIEDVWGIGRRYSKMLKYEGIKTAWQFTEQSAYWVKRNMNIPGLRTYEELRGRSVIAPESHVDKKSICTSRSFGKMVDVLDSLEQAVAAFAVGCAEKLREQKSVARQVTVFILTNLHREDLPKYYNSATIILPEASNDTLEIAGEAVQALRGIFRKGFLYKKAGVIVSEIQDENGIQQNLFVRQDYDKRRKLNQVLDGVNSRYGNNSLRLAAQGYEQDWRMRKEHLSGCFTTNIKDIIEIG